MNPTANIPDSNSGDILPFERDQVERLLRGEIPPDQATALLSCAVVENLDLDALKLFVDLISESATGDKFSAVNSVDMLKDLKGTFDCSGTGGSGLPHYNISTAVAFILSAAGVPTTNFANFATGHRSGSLDLLFGLGIDLSLSVEAMIDVYQKTNLMFLPAQHLFPALAMIAPLKELVVCPTVFSLINPLLNPVSPQFRLIGTPELRGQELLAEYLCDRKMVTRAAVVTSTSGLDELEFGELNLVTFLDENGPSSTDLRFGEQLNDKPWGPISKAESLRAFQKLIKSEIGEGNFFYHNVCLNAGFSLMLAGKARHLEEGCEEAARLLKTGEVKAKFEQYCLAVSRGK
jgi:anthranilate phosphoribosyltransferase